MNHPMVGNPAMRFRVAVKNGEASASIPIGTPVALSMSGTDDGIAVILPSSSAAKTHAFAYGVALSTITAGKNGETQVYGLVDAVVLLQTRTASGESFSASTHTFGVILNVDTVNNAFSTSGGTLAKTSYLPFAVLAESTVAAASASATSDTRTAVTAMLKVFVRMM